MRRLRDQGVVPAVLYGHKQSNVNLEITGDQVRAAVRHGARLVNLAGDVQETALIRQVQWDAFGVEVLHLDLTRVSSDEAVELVLPIHLKGTAAGTREGGVVEHIKHEVKILCPVVSIPEHLTLNVNNLHVGQSLTLAELPLPAGAKLLTDAGEIVVMCVTPVEVDETAATAEPGEPEVIGRKKDEEEGAAEDE
jgi:large subunit ribosomal protein L25